MGKKKEMVGRLIGMTGIYAGAEIEVNGAEVKIGRDSSKVNLVISGDRAKHVSRVHCGVRYESASDQYVVTDYSSDATCTKIGGGDKLPKHASTVLPAGTVLELGNADNTFRLGIAQEKTNKNVTEEKQAGGGKAVASLVLGILSLVLAVFGFGYRWLAVVLGLLGIIFGALGRKCVEKKGMATAGLVMSIIGALIGILLYVACASLANSIGDMFGF